jgi:hypothetical protein
VVGHQLSRHLRQIRQEAQKKANWPAHCPLLLVALSRMLLAAFSVGQHPRWQPMRWPTAADLLCLPGEMLELPHPLQAQKCWAGPAQNPSWCAQGQALQLHSLHL